MHFCSVCDDSSDLPHYNSKCMNYHLQHTTYHTEVHFMYITFTALYSIIVLASAS